LLFFSLSLSADESDSGIGLCGWLLTMISWGIVAVTLPFSLFVCFKVSEQEKEAVQGGTGQWDERYLSHIYFQVVQEYERAVIFRLGRLLSDGSRGPGIVPFQLRQLIN
jgi:erythrocyte band 7 integral membrane protein